MLHEIASFLAMTKKPKSLALIEVEILLWWSR